MAAIATACATAAWAPPLLPGIASDAAGSTLAVRCLYAGEWSAAGLPSGRFAVLRGRTVVVADHACAVLVGYATSLPYLPEPGTSQELDVTRSLYRFLGAAVSKLGLSPPLADCRTVKSFVPALIELGVASRSYAVMARTRLLAARKRLHLRITLSEHCSVQLPPAAQS